MKNWVINPTSKTLSAIMPYLVCLLSALFFAYELVQFHMMNAISPFLIKDLNLTASSFANLCAFYLLADVLFLLPAGIILDHFSPRKVILVALSCCILGTFGFSMSQNFFEASFCHFLSGIGNAFCLLSSLILVSRWFDEKKQAMIMSLVVTIGMLGAVVAQMPFSLLSSLFSWRVALLIDGIIGICLLGLIYLFVYDKKLPQKEEKIAFPFWQGLKLSIFNLQNCLLGLYTSLINMPLMVIGAVFGTLFLHQVHHIETTKASFIISMISFGTIFGSTLFGYLATKTGSKKPWMHVGSLSSLLTFILIQTLPSPSHFELTALFFLLGLFTSSQVLSYPLISENNPKPLIGTSMGVAALLIMGLPMLIQPLTGYLLDTLWDGSFANGNPVYSKESFFTAFSIFPTLFIIAFTLTFFIKEKKFAQVDAGNLS